MKKIILALLFIGCFALEAKWVFVAENVGGNERGEGDGDMTYVWHEYTTDPTKGNSYRRFRILQKLKQPQVDYRGNKIYSAESEISVYCNNPNKVTFQNFRYYSGSMGTGLLDTDNESKMTKYLTGIEPGAYAVKMVCN